MAVIVRTAGVVVMGGIAGAAVTVEAVVTVETAPPSLGASTCCSSSDTS